MQHGLFRYLFFQLVQDIIASEIVVVLNCWLIDFVFFFFLQGSSYILRKFSAIYEGMDEQLQRGFRDEACSYGTACFGLLCVTRKAVGCVKGRTKPV